MSRSTNHSNFVIPRVCDFLIFSCFCTTDVLQSPPERRHPERLADLSHNRGFYARSRDPGDACWQMLFGAFRPQTTREIKKSQPPSAAEGPAVRLSVATTLKTLRPNNQMSRSANHLNLVIPRGCDFFDFFQVWCPESSEEHRPTSIRGVPSTPRQKPSVSDRSARRFAPTAGQGRQDDGLVRSLKNILGGCAKNTKMEKVTGSDRSVAQWRDLRFLFQFLRSSSARTLQRPDLFRRAIDTSGPSPCVVTLVVLRQGERDVRPMHRLCRLLFGTIPRHIRLFR